MECIIIKIAIPIIKRQTATPVRSVMIPRISSVFSSLKALNMAVSKVSIDTQAAARLIAFDADMTGLLYRRYLTIFTIARDIDAKVYAAIAIVVI